MGNFRIGIELKKRGISSSIVDEVLARRDENELYPALVKTISDKYGYLDREKRFRRAQSYLRRRGFQHDMIGRIMDDAFQNSEDTSD